MTFYSCDIDLDPMTSIYEFDQDVLKMYLCIKNEVLGQCFRKLEHEQNRQTDRRTRPNALSAALADSSDSYCVRFPPLSNFTLKYVVMISTTICKLSIK